MRMKTVLIANRDQEEAKALLDIASQEFRVSVINSPEEFTCDLQDVNLVLLDCNLTPQSGIDFIGEILKKSYLPILITTSPDDAKIATEALKAGAYNYIIKTAHYLEMLNFMIADAIQRFDKYEQMKQTISGLQRKVAELEESLAHQGRGGDAYNKNSGREPAKQRSTIFDEMILRLKRGEINLPSPPQIQIKFEEMIREGAGISEIANLLKQDVSICSKLISISNSAYYQGIKENRTVEQAISRLGLITTKKYVGIIYNRALYTTQKEVNMEILERLWRHSICCGITSQLTCEIMGIKQAEEVFTMGLIHDIGMLILLQIFSELDISLTDGKMKAEDRAELMRAISLNHGAFGATLLKRWGFSDLYQQIALFHDNIENADPISKELLIIHFANSLAKSIGYHWQEKAEAKPEESPSTRLLQMGPSVIEQVKEKAQQHMSDLQSLF
jgi:HD-like signal output (HDOD) protein/FixJ family two-component response regulator